MSVVQHIIGGEWHAVRHGSIWHNFYALCGRPVRKVDVNHGGPFCRSCVRVQDARAESHTTPTHGGLNPWPTRVVQHR